MREYHKIETVFNRSTDGDKRLIWGDYRNETVEYLAGNIWQFTEKIDGTNIRIHWDGHNVEIGGRTDRAQIPKHLMDYLNLAEALKISSRITSIREKVIN